MKWRCFRVHHKPLTCIQSLCLLSQSEIHFKVPAYFYAVTSNKYIDIFNDAASYFVNWYAVKGEAASVQWEFCRRKFSATYYCQGMFRLEIKNSFLTGRVMVHWHRLPREAGESLSLEMFENCGDVTLRDTAGMVGWVGIGPGDFRGLFQLLWFY